MSTLLLYLFLYVVNRTPFFFCSFFREAGRRIKVVITKPLTTYSNSDKPAHLKRVPGVHSRNSMRKNHLYVACS